MMTPLGPAQKTTPGVFDPGYRPSKFPPGVNPRAPMPKHASVGYNLAMQRNRIALAKLQAKQGGGRAIRGGGMYPGGGVYQGGGPFPGGGAYPGRGGHRAHGHPAHPINPYGGGHPARGRSHSRAPTRGSHHGNTGYRGGLRGPHDRGIPGSAHPSRAGSRHPTMIDDGIDGRDPNRGRSTQVPRRGRSASVNPGINGRVPTRGGSTRGPRRATSANPGFNGRAPVRSPSLAPTGVRRPPNANGINAIGEQINDMTYLNQ